MALKVASFQKVFPKQIFQITILNLKFEFPAHNNLFKFQAQNSDLEYLFWRSEKCMALSEKKPPLAFRSYDN